MTNLSRRKALKSAGAGGLLVAGFATGLLRPSRAFAQRYRGALEAKTVKEALANLKDVSQGALPFLALRVKLAESSNLRAVVAAADGKFYSAQKEIKVTIGGCAG
jgi:hypothetical protein